MGNCYVLDLLCNGPVMYWTSYVLDLLCIGPTIVLTLNGAGTILKYFETVERYYFIIFIAEIYFSKICTTLKCITKITITKIYIINFYVTTYIIFAKFYIFKFHIGKAHVERYFIEIFITKIYFSKICSAIKYITKISTTKSYTVNFYTIMFIIFAKFVIFIVRKLIQMSLETTKRFYNLRIIFVKSKTYHSDLKLCLWFQHISFNVIQYTTTLINRKENISKMYIKITNLLKMYIIKNLILKFCLAKLLKISLSSYYLKTIVKNEKFLYKTNIEILIIISIKNFSLIHVFLRTLDYFICLSLMNEICFQLNHFIKIYCFQKCITVLLKKICIMKFISQLLLKPKISNENFVNYDKKINSNKIFNKFNKNYHKFLSENLKVCLLICLDFKTLIEICPYIIEKIIFSISILVPNFKKLKLITWVVHILFLFSKLYIHLQNIMLHLLKTNFAILCPLETLTSLCMIDKYYKNNFPGYQNYMFITITVIVIFPHTISLKIFNQCIIIYHTAHSYDKVEK